MLPYVFTCYTLISYLFYDELYVSNVTSGAAISWYYITPFFGFFFFFILFADENFYKLNRFYIFWGLTFPNKIFTLKQYFISFIKNKNLFTATYILKIMNIISLYMFLTSIFYYFFPHIFFKTPALIITYIFCFFIFIFLYLYITLYEIYTLSEFYQQLAARFVTKKYEFYQSMDKSFIYDLEEGYEDKHYTTFTLGIFYKLRYFILLLFLLYFYHKA